MYLGIKMPKGWFNNRSILKCHAISLSKSLMIVYHPELGILRILGFRLSLESWFRI
jgi:hypothetical protein